MFHVKEDSAVDVPLMHIGLKTCVDETRTPIHSVKMSRFLDSQRLCIRSSTFGPRDNVQTWPVVDCPEIDSAAGIQCSSIGHLIISKPSELASVHPSTPLPIPSSRDNMFPAQERDVSDKVKMATIWR
jgi:hypothetical protein